MKRAWMALTLASALALLPAGPAVAAEDAPHAPVDAGDIERQIEQARRQLDEAARLLGDLHKKQYIHGDGKKKAMLGILLGDTSKSGGVELVGVTPGGGAEAAGLKAGDSIVKVDETALTENGSPMRVLSKYMKNVAPGEQIVVVYERDGKRETATITTQARATHMQRMFDEKMGKLDFDFDFDFDSLAGLPHVKKEIWKHKDGHTRRLLAVEGDLAEYFDVEQGVVLIEPPADSQLKAGDVLLRVGDNEVEDLKGAMSALEKIDDSADVEVQRHGKRRVLKVAGEEFAALTHGTETRVIRIKKPGTPEDEVVVKVEVVD